MVWHTVCDKVILDCVTSHTVRDIMMKMMTSLHTGQGVVLMEEDENKWNIYNLLTDASALQSEEKLSKIVSPLGATRCSVSAFFQQIYISCFFEGIPYHKKFGFGCCIDQLLDGEYQVLDI